MVYEPQSLSDDSVLAEMGVRNLGHDYGRDPGTGPISDRTVEQIALGLGWFSIGLGLAQLLAPRAINNLIGVRDADRNRALMQLIGLREIATGIGILRSDRPTGWLMGRVGGDLMDLALLTAAMSADDSDTDRVIGAVTAVLGVAALDVLASERFARNDELTTEHLKDDDTPTVRKYITVMKPVEEVYAFWRDFSNLPKFMHHLESVEVLEDGLSHWVARAPMGRTVSWNASIVRDEPNRLIAWRSLPGADIANEGVVRFNAAPGDRGTEVRVDLRYSLPGGGVVATLAKLFPENPEREVYDDLRAFKQVMETGDVVRSEALAGGSRIKQHPAQPPEQ